MNNSPYSVILKHSAQKEIRALDAVVRTRVLNSIRSLASDARPSGCRKLVGALIAGGFESATDHLLG